MYVESILLGLVVLIVQTLILTFLRTFWKSSGCRPQRRMLRWHYRSRHETLIDFSNHHFYDRRLNTFPSADAVREGLGVRFVYVDDGVYARGGSRANEVEADRVATAVLEHFRTTPDRLSEDVLRVADGLDPHTKE